MRTLIFFLLATLLLGAGGCGKDPVTPTPTNTDFTLTVHNDFNELQAHYGVFLTDLDGKVTAFEWIPGQDSAQLVIKNAKENAVYDCTVAKIIVIDAPGSGVKDSTIALTTYTNLSSGQHIYLRTNDYKRVCDLRIQFTNLTSLDSIIVSDGLTISRPHQNNNFFGEYQVVHTGKFWLRILINGENHWRLMRFDDINVPDVVASIDATLLPVMFSSPKTIALPFVTSWAYNVEGVSDLGKQQFFPLGDLIRAPGGAIPVYNSLSVYEPVINEVFDPTPKPYNGFRVQVNGANTLPDGYLFQSDRLYTEMPTEITPPAAKAVVSPLSNKRFAGATCSGDFDVLSFLFSKSGAPAMQWEVFLPGTTGILSYQLPDLPEALQAVSPSLKNYDFTNKVQAKAEVYDALQGYNAVIAKRLTNNDPLWQAKAGFSARGE